MLDFTIWNPTPVPACPRCTPAVVHFPAAVRTIKFSCQQASFPAYINLAHGLSQFLHHVPSPAVYDCLMGITENKDILTGIFYRFLVFIGFLVASKIHGVSHIFRSFQYPHNRAARPVIRGFKIAHGLIIAPLSGRLIIRRFFNLFLRKLLCDLVRSHALHGQPE